MRIVKAMLVAAVASGCNWVSLAVNAASYESLGAGDAGNVVVRDSVGFVSLGDSGIAIVGAESGRRLHILASPAGLESVDDIAVDGSFLFALDARPPGALAVFSLNDALHPSFLSARAVAVGPFSGVSANKGHVAVSGGTSELSLMAVDSRGALGVSEHFDLGRGQPDVLLHGATLFVSAHYWGPYFGLDVVHRDSATRTMRRIARVELAGAGFTAGGAKPANFPLEAALFDSTTLLVAHRRGVAVINVRSHADARLIQVLDVGGPAVNVDARDSLAAVAVGGNAPAVVLIRFEPAAARVVRRVTLPPGTKPAGIALSRRSVLVAARGQGVLAVKR
jgi:hypothetical protein